MWSTYLNEVETYILGTVITEWSEGVKLWDEVLESEHKFKNFASALVAIAKCLKFDGWLLNVENKVKIVYNHTRGTCYTLAN